MLYCQALQAKLVEVETSEENSYLRLHLFDIGRQSSVDFWMGMTDLVAEGHWRWMSTQSNATFMDWYPGEPNNGNDEDCATFGINYSWHWNDVDCTAKMNYICEKSIKEEVSVIG
ncbi:perlucin-like protein [Saccostrea cucullata]|uniref:perlucin-like protein n=1 Tax=Saccostrea cuccullata TaxID=36930 RepID=UPI002ED43E52